MGKTVNPDKPLDNWQVFETTGKRLDNDSSRAMYDLRFQNNFEWLPNEHLFPSFKDCFLRVKPNYPVGLELVLPDDGNTATLICRSQFDTDAPSYPIDSFEISDNLANKIRTVTKGQKLPEKDSAAVLSYTEGVKIWDKLEKGWQISFQDLRVLIELDTAGETWAGETLKKRSLQALLGTSPKAPLKTEDLLAITHTISDFTKYWRPSEVVTFVSQIYTAAVPSITNDAYSFYYDGTGKLEVVNDAGKAVKNKHVEVAREVVKKASDVIYKFCKKELPVAVEFFLKEILQKPNPENLKKIEKFISGYDKLPVKLKQRTAAFLKSELDLDEMMGSFTTYFNSCPICTKILAFAYRKGKRIEARNKLIDQMLIELTSYETDALRVYIDELVVKERDLPSIAELKRIIMMGIKGFSRASRKAKTLVLKEILLNDTAYEEIYKPFLDGQESIDIEEGGIVKKKYFDMEFFARTELLPFQGGDSVEEKSVSWKYCDTIYYMLKRRYYKAVSGHLDSFYTELKKDSDPWYKWDKPNDHFALGWILSLAFAETGMHEFLLSRVRGGGELLGYEIIKTACSTTMPREYIEKDPEFLAKLKALPLDAVKNRLEAEVRFIAPDGEYFEMVNIGNLISTASDALFNGFEKANDIIIDGFNHTDLRIRHAFLYGCAKKFDAYAPPDGNEIENRAKIKLPFETWLKVADVRDSISEADLSYTANLLSDVISYHYRNDKSTNTPTKTIGDFLAIISSSYRNPNVIQALEGLYDAAAVMPQECDVDKWAEKIYKDLGKALYSLYDTWHNDIYLGKITNDNLWIERSEKGIESMMGLLGRLLDKGNFVADSALNLLGKIGLDKQMKKEAVQTLIAAANARNSGSMVALSQLFEIWQKEAVKPDETKDSGLVAEILNFLQNFNPIGIVDSSCHPTGHKDRWCKILVVLIMLGNHNAYKAWRDYLISSSWGMVQELPEKRNLKELITRSNVQIIEDALILVQFATNGYGPEWLTKEMARDLSQLIKNGWMENIEWAIQNMANLEGADPVIKSGLDVFGAGTGFEIWLKWQGGNLKKDENALAIVTLLALSSISRYSEMARFMMLGVDKESPYYQTFAKYKSAWIAQHEGRGGRASDSLVY